jgi:hypothetical protein
MAAFLVTFEINDSTRANRFREHLKLFGSYCPMNNNSWIIISNLSAIDLLNQLQEQVDILNDKLFILRTGSEAAWSAIYAEPWHEWLSKNLG